MDANLHVSVLAKEVLELVPESAKIAFDGTLGGGGHTRLLLEKKLHVVASDLDAKAIELVTGTLAEDLALRLETVHMSFVDALKFQDRKFDFILADLGFSSNQLDNSGRGFSYLKRDDLLDLRYDRTSGTACWKRMKKIGPKDITNVIYRNSGEALAGKIGVAFSNVLAEHREPTVGDFVDAIDAIIPNFLKKKTNSILSRVWQALRIWTNFELELLTQFLQLIPDKLNTNGVAAIICFHSLEDKLVTKFFRSISAPIVIDAYGNTEHKFELLTKKPIIPSVEEVANNVRSRSAMLRAVHKAS